jgi:hypothetical protein
MVPRVALLNSHGLEREGEAAARKSCLRSCVDPFSLSLQTQASKEVALLQEWSTREGEITSWVVYMECLWCLEDIREGEGWKWKLMNMMVMFVFVPIFQDIKARVNGLDIWGCHGVENQGSGLVRFQMDLEDMWWIWRLMHAWSSFGFFEFVFPLGQQWHAKMDKKDVIGWE